MKEIRTETKPATSSREKRKSMDARGEYLKYNRGLFGCIYFCPYCFRAITREQLAVDHIRPLADKHGKNVRRNLVGACKKCNSEKSDKVTRSYLIRGNLGRVFFRGLMILQNLVISILVVGINFVLWLARLVLNLIAAPYRTDSSTSGNSISFDTAQTAIAIALYNLDEAVAARAVLECATTGSKNDERLQTIIRNRQQLVEDCNRINSSDLVYALLQYLSSNKVLLVERSSVYAKSRVMASLTELLKAHSEMQIYSEAMRLLVACVNTNGLIDMFMLTNVSMEKLKKTIITKTFLSANGVSQNVVTDGDLNIIMDEFMVFVRRYCIDQYDPSTGTPIAYLRNAFNSYFWKGENAKNAYKQINTQGLDREIGKDGYTILDTIGVEDGTRKREEFPFLRVVSAIQDLSQDLFQHNGSESINYDIVSLYKAEKLNLDYRKYRASNTKHSYSVKFSDSMCDGTVGNAQTISQKFNGRRTLCLSLFGLLKGQITPEVLLNKYRELLAINNGFPAKNNVMYFSRENANSTSNKSNSEKYELMVRGVLALRSLLEFLNSKDNKTGVTIRTLPTHIFRNRNLNSNFTTFESYVENIDSVLLLMNEVAVMSTCPYDSEAGKIMDNVSIRNRVNSLLMQDSADVLKKLLRVPLSVAQQMIMTEDKDNSINRLLLTVSEIRRKRNLAVVKPASLLFTTRDLEKETSIDLFMKLIDQVGKLYKVARPVPGVDMARDADAEETYFERVVDYAVGVLANPSKIGKLSVLQSCNFLNVFKILEVMAERAGNPLYQCGVVGEHVVVHEQTENLTDLFHSILYNACKADFDKACEKSTEEQREVVMAQFEEIIQAFCPKCTFLLLSVSGVSGAVCEDLAVPNLDAILHRTEESIEGEELARQVSHWFFKLSVASSYLRKTIATLFQVLEVCAHPQNEVYVTKLTLSTCVRFLALRNPTTSIKDLDAVGTKVSLPSWMTTQGEIIYDSELVASALDAALEMVNGFVLAPYSVLFANFNKIADLLAVPNYSGSRVRVSGHELDLLKKHSTTAILLFTNVIEDSENEHNMTVSAINASFNTDSDGYCIKNDWYVTKKNEQGHVLYMHSTGYWIDIAEMENNRFTEVTRSEVVRFA